MIRQTIYIEQYGWKATIYYPVHHFHTQEIMSRLEDLVYNNFPNNSNYTDPVYNNFSRNNIFLNSHPKKNSKYNQVRDDFPHSESSDNGLDYSRLADNSNINHKQKNVRTKEGERVLQSAYELMSMQKENTGLTYSNYNLSESLIVVGKTTSRAQFANTLFHECTHLCVNIAEARHIDHSSEEFAYLAGTIAQAFFEVAQYFMCECTSCHTQLETLSE